jgi:hypothetical protein
MIESHSIVDGTDDENLLRQRPSQLRPKRVAVASAAFLLAIGIAAFCLSGPIGVQTGVHDITYATILDEIPDFKPFEITPCNPLVASSECTNKCGEVRGYKCDSPGWVFCQNAVCDEVPVKNGSAWVSNCHCWQPTNTDSSILPVTSNSGANCVLDMGPGGQEMCEAIDNGALWSTYGPDGTYLPGKPLKAASCAAHTIWAWCWGAPCKKEGDDVICACPIMKSMNSAAQAISLAGEEQCPPKVEDPCAKGWTHNSMPAGTSPSEFMPDAASSQCYDYADSD